MYFYIYVHTYIHKYNRMGLFVCLFILGKTYDVLPCEVWYYISILPGRFKTCIYDVCVYMCTILHTHYIQIRRNIFKGSANLMKYKHLLYEQCKLALFVFFYCINSKVISLYRKSIKLIFVVILSEMVIWLWQNITLLSKYIIENQNKNTVLRILPQEGWRFQSRKN